MKIFSIFLLIKIKEEVNAENETASNFSIHYKIELRKVNKFIDQFQKQEPGSLTSRIIQIICRN